MTKSKIVLVSVTAALALLAFSFFYLRQYLGFTPTNAVNLEKMTLVSEQPNLDLDAKKNPPTIRFEPVVEGLDVPWSILFTSENRMLISERAGAIRVVENGQLRAEPLIAFSEVSSTGEEGLMGLVLDPNYAENRIFYACMAYPKNNVLVDKVVRLVDQQDSATVDSILIDDIPAARFHAGCELGFGPDGKLYITTGDATDKNIAQDLNSLGGKILRVNSDGTVPSDNPFPNSAIWSYGHRNPQGIAWHPATNQLFSAEHGPSVIDGPSGGDEINIISKGANYGWPVVSHDKSAEGMVNPLLVFTPAIAPGSAHFYAADALPTFTNDLFVALLKGEGILRVVLAPPDYTTVSFYQKLPELNVGRVREITTGPDGALYFATSNRDGRGEAQVNDDKIYRLTAE